MRAKVFSDTEVESVLAICDFQEKAMVLASFRAGLRACELAALDWQMLRTPSGELADAIDLPPSATKRQLGAGRIPVAADLHSALLALSARMRHPMSGPVFCDVHLARLSPEALAVRLKRLYERAGLRGTSHSGRRTFGDTLAKKVNLPTLQLAMRHRDMASTLRYFDPASDDVLSAAIRGLGA